MTLFVLGLPAKASEKQYFPSQNFQSSQTCSQEKTKASKTYLILTLPSSWSNSVLADLKTQLGRESGMWAGISQVIFHSSAPIWTPNSLRVHKTLFNHKILLGISQTLLGFQWFPLTAIFPSSSKEHIPISASIVWLCFRQTHPKLSYQGNDIFFS